QVHNHLVVVVGQIDLFENVKGLRAIFSDDEFNELASARKDLIKEISAHISSIKSKTKDMIEARKVANVIEETRERALAYEQNVRPYLDDIRYHIDKLELVVDNELWPLPKYRELLFAR
ncbi:MAG: glutamine synthetase type III, partial [Bacteroidetes bacterium]|nr:glutamine synthetase type III [Bacteroidota bacterium]